MRDMPLSDQDINDLVAYLASLRPRIAERRCSRRRERNGTSGTHDARAMKEAGTGREVRNSRKTKATRGREAAVREALNERTESARSRRRRKEKTKHSNPTRRDWLFTAGVAVNVAAGLLLAVPLIGFVFSSFVERKDPRSWISLGRSKLSRRKRRASRPIEIRSRGPGTAKPPIFRAGCGVFRAISFRCLRSTARIWAVPVRWFPESGLFMCPCHGGAYYEDGSRAAGPPPRGLFQYDYKVENGAALGEGRRNADTLKPGIDRETIRMNWLEKRSGLAGRPAAPDGALYASTAGHEVPASAGSWFYVFGSATLLCFVIQIITGACLAFVYVPSTNEAYTSLQYLNHAQFWAGICAPCTTGDRTSWSRS